MLVEDSTSICQTLSTPSVHNVLNPTNVNLTQAQKELLRWHVRLGHANLPLTQAFLRPRAGDLEPLLHSRVQRVGQCDIPMCEACAKSKARRRTPHTSSTS